MEDKLKTVYKFLQDNNLHGTLDLLKQEMSSMRIPQTNPTTFESNKRDLSSQQYIHKEREEDNKPQ